MKRLVSIIALFAATAAMAVTVEQFSPAPGVEFRTTSGGALRHAQVFSGVSGGTAKLERVLAVDCYTNAVEILTSTQTTFTVVFSNTVSHAVFTNEYPQVDGVRPPVYCVVTSSNIVNAVSATTNTWPVMKETVTTKETIFSGTLSGNSYTNAFGGVYLLPGERLVFTGTAATNGWIRLVLE